ncbi:MaoC family dehydratase [soil metagenome]
MTAHIPYAEDLTIGVPLASAPDITIDAGLAAQYLAITGDQLPLALSDRLSADVTGSSARLANPGLVIALSIGQSTVATRRVIANLLYRNLTLSRQVHLGETIRTVVTPLEASWTRTGTDRAKVLLQMAVTADGEPLTTYERLALLPVAEPRRLVATDPAPNGSEPELATFAATIPSGWSSPAGVVIGEADSGEDPLSDTVSSARELVRLTQNLAAAHRDASAGQGGRRLVYGGHTVALAQASLSRTLPGILTVLAWRSCDHLAPVFEDDLLTFGTTVNGVHATGGFQLVDVTVVASREAEPVLRWRPVILCSGTEGA